MRIPTRTIFTFPVSLNTVTVSTFLSPKESCTTFYSILADTELRGSAIRDILIFFFEISDARFLGCLLNMWAQLNSNFLEKNLHAVRNVKNGCFITNRITEGSKDALHPFVPVIEKYLDAG